MFLKWIVRESQSTIFDIRGELWEHQKVDNVGGRSASNFRFECFQPANFAIVNLGLDTSGFVLSGLQPD